METIKEQELDELLRIQKSNELSSEEEPAQEDVFRKSQYRKPIKNAFSDEEEDSDSSVQPSKMGTTPLPPKPMKPRSVLQQAQEQMRWTREETTEIDVLSKLEGTGVKDKKIRELALKIKNINIAYQREKTMRRMIENQLNSTLKANQEVKRVEDERHSLQKTTNSKKEKEKCSNCSEQEKKVMQIRLKVQNMKTQVNKAHRVIARELGQNFDIDQALSEENGWKGRQQRIQKLKSRVKDLQEKLANNGINVSHMSGFSQMPPPTKNSSFTATQRSSTLADNKRKELQNLKVQVQALRSENDLLQGKVKSLNSRKLILENDMKEIKSDFQKKKQIFIEKSENDDRFIALLKQENDKLKREEKVVTKVVYKESKENNEEVNMLKKEIDSLKKKTRELQKQRDELQMMNQLSKEEKPIKAVSEIPRQISNQKKRQLEQEFIKGTKYLKKLSVEDEEEIYKAWKQSKNKI